MAKYAVGYLVTALLVLVLVAGWAWGGYGGPTILNPRISTVIVEPARPAPDMPHVLPGSELPAPTVPTLPPPRP